MADKFVTKRHRLDPINEPIYSFAEVPRAKRNLPKSVVVEINSRQKWISLLGEVLLLCNEAANRRKASQYVPPGHRGKPLSLEYIADRFDLDDPLRGYTVRSSVEGWLQGFVTVTDFTTWQSYFRWDSMRRESEITDESIDYLHELDEETETLTWMKERVRDLDGKIAWELSQQVHDGDYSREGVVWPRIAEISLLAGIGCGSWLLQLIIDQLEAPESKYQWLVLQASENAVSFYEKFGFVRVGAVARYDSPNKTEDSDDSDDDKSSSEEDSDSDYSDDSDGSNDSDASDNSDSDDSEDSDDSDDDDDDDNESKKKKQKLNIKTKKKKRTKKKR
jgi:GNAT superfamily N-acetyltransferase